MWSRGSSRTTPISAIDLDRLEVVRGRRGGRRPGVLRRCRRPLGRGALAARARRDRRRRRSSSIAGEAPYRSVLDLGTGTGRMLQLLTNDGVDRAVGIDNSHSMLAVARANLERAEVRRVDLRQGDVYSPPFEHAAVRLVVIHQVLHFLDDPARADPRGGAAAVAGRPAADRRLRPALARVPAHRARPSPARVPHRHRQPAGWFTPGSTSAPTRTIDPPDGGDDERLTVCLWQARQPSAPRGVTPARRALRRQGAAR